MVITHPASAGLFFRLLEPKINPGTDQWGKDMPNPLTFSARPGGSDGRYRSRRISGLRLLWIKLAEEAEDWVARDNTLRLVRVWLAAAQDVQNATDMMFG